VFCVIEASNRFNAKINTSHREYSYYLPSFTLASISKDFYLGKLGLPETAEAEDKKENGPKDDDIVEQKVVNGITITKRLTNEGDTRDGQENFLGRNITHLTQYPELLKRLYGFRLSPA